MTTDATCRTVSRYLSLASAPSNASDTIVKMNRRARGLGPVLKNGGGWCSITREAGRERREAEHHSASSPPASRRPPPVYLIIREDRRQTFHLLEGLTRAAHDAREWIVRDHDGKTRFLHQEAIDVA